MALEKQEVADFRDGVSSRADSRGALVRRAMSVLRSYVGVFWCVRSLDSLECIGPTRVIWMDWSVGGRTAAGRGLGTIVQGKVPLSVVLIRVV